VQYVKGEVEGFEFERLRPKAEIHAMGDLETADDEKWRSQRIIGCFVSLAIGLLSLSTSLSICHFPFYRPSFQVRAQMTDASARPIRAHMIVNCAGPWAGKIAEMAGIGKGNGLLAVPVPIQPRKRQIFVVHAPDVPIDLPFLIDPSGVHVRQDDVGKTFLVGRNPSKVGGCVNCGSVKRHFGSGV
jgi:FAD-dependent oxidoreductase domain-containing protein 1